MSLSDEPVVKRTRLNNQEIDGMTREDIIAMWRARERYIDALELKQSGGDLDPDDKLKQGARREQVLVMRLTTKEHEMQEYLNQIQELKQAHSNSTSQLRSVLLDPAVNLMFERLKRELDETKQKLEQTKMDLSAWKFTPDSQTGKRLMAKCRMLLQENDELGKVTSSGRIAKLEGSIALEKTLVQEMKKGQAEIDDFLVELEEDLEGMQSTIYLLQQQLKEAKEENSRLTTEIMELRKIAVPNIDAEKPIILSTQEMTEELVATDEDNVSQGKSEADNSSTLVETSNNCPPEQPTLLDEDNTMDIGDVKDDEHTPEEANEDSSCTENLDSSPSSPEA